MKVLASKLYHVRDHSTWFCDRSADTEIESNYTLMRDIMLASAEQYCEGLDQVVIHTGTVDSIQDAFRDHLTGCYELWQAGHDVLSVDLDVVFTNLHLWFTGDQFQLYAHTDPHRTAEFEHYLNVGIKYFPSTLPERFWLTLMDSFSTWDDSVYDHEQKVLNRLFWAQSSQEDLLRYVDHSKAYQWLGHPALNHMFNRGADWHKAKAVHVHGSRGSADRLAVMQQIRDATQ